MCSNFFGLVVLEAKSDKSCFFQQAVFHQKLTQLGCSVRPDRGQKICIKIWSKFISLIQNKIGLNLWHNAKMDFLAQIQFGTARLFSEFGAASFLKFCANLIWCCQVFLTWRGFNKKDMHHFLQWHPVMPRESLKKIKQREKCHYIYWLWDSSLLFCFCTFFWRSCWHKTF